LKSELVALLSERQRRINRNRLKAYRPYSKQREFHAAGADHRERLLMAGNQLGKTFSGAAEVAMHLTGLYPDWWEGRRFDRPTRWWAGSKTGEVTRDGVQRLLVGEPKDAARWGEGMIPGDDLVDHSRRQGVPDALDSVLVKHEPTGGTSSLGFKSYDQGREKWQGETLDGVWFDEEPPIDIYMEGLTRTNATGGIVFLTFTPLLGMSDVVSMFLEA
jgi:phage terminase large subunit-like protein